MNNGLTFSVIFDANSANFGEGLGNISELKKLTRDNKQYTFISRQALRYDVFRMIDNKTKISAPLSKSQGVIQFAPEANIKDHAEADLFGYMKTKKKDSQSGEKGGSDSRPAVVRFSPAISLEPYHDDIEFAANHNFAKRSNENPDPFQLETHSSLYTYTVTIDLNRIGKDDKDGKVVISNKERIERVNSVLDVIKVLNREIKSRIESFNPVFIIGGVYPIKNPYFLGRVKLNKSKDGKPSIDTKILSSTAEPIKGDTMIGRVDSFFVNDFEKEIQGITVLSIEDFFNKQKEKVKKYYESL